MARQGRKPLGAGHVDHLSGSQQAKLRLTMILQTMLGELSVAEACAQMGVCESRFHALRNEWLQEALELLEPRRVGRPAKTVDSEESRQIEQLTAALQRTEQELEAARVREEIAQIVGATSAAGNGAGKKRTPPPSWQAGGTDDRGRAAQSGAKRVSGSGCGPAMHDFPPSEKGGSCLCRQFRFLCAWSVYDLWRDRLGRRRFQRKGDV